MTCDDLSSWSRRLLTAISPMFTGPWAGFWCGLLLVLIVTVGLLLSPPPPSSRPSLQHQLDSLEQRVRALEQR
jgi:hypothetical protein